MKRKRLPSLLKTTFLAVPVAAMMLGSAHGVQFGINFDGEGYQDPATNVTASAFGIDPTNWFTTSVVADDEAGTNVIALPMGGLLTLAWSANNTWTSNLDNDGAGSPLPGDPEVTWGYLDDGGPGYTATLSGLRSFAGSYSLQTIAATDNATAFGNCEIRTNNGVVEPLNYPNTNAVMLIL